MEVLRREPEGGVRWRAGGLSEKRIGGRADVRVVAARDLDTADVRLRLVLHVALVRQRRREPHVVLDDDERAQAAEAQVADVDQACVVHAAGRIRVARIGAAGTVTRFSVPGTYTAPLLRRPSSSRSEKFGSGVVDQILDADPVTQRVAGRRVRGRVLTGGDVDRRLLEAQHRQIDRDGVRVLVVRDAHGAVGQRARVTTRGPDSC